MNEPGNDNKDKMLRAEKIIESFFLRMDQHTQSNAQLTAAINRIADMGEDLMPIVIKYGMAFDEVIEQIISRYKQKAAEGVSALSPLLGQIGEILDKVKALKEE